MIIAPGDVTGEGGREGLGERGRELERSRVGSGVGTRAEGDSKRAVKRKEDTGALAEELE